MVKITNSGDIARFNINLVAEQAYRSLTDFRIERVSIQGAAAQDRVIQINGLARRIFYAIFSSAAAIRRRQTEILETLRASVSRCSAQDSRAFVSNGEITQLFLDAQRFNQAIQINHDKEGSIASKFMHSTEQFMISCPQTELQTELCPAEAKATEYLNAEHDDQPICQGAHLRYPGDDRFHGIEAAKIFFRTQAQRLAAICSDRHRYFRGGVTEKEFHVEDAPMNLGSRNPSSYWIGHATCLMNIPLRSVSERMWKTFNVLTDPVEGDLNAFLYPRQTKAARTMEQCPAIHVMLLSHNHLDHYSESTMKKLLSLQPIMVVPKGDGKMVRSLGFANVREQNWWDHIDIEFTSANETYRMWINAVPSHHWAGQGFRGTRSTFNGYVIRGCEGGDIYYAGDTARLNAEHIRKLRERFDIRWMYQPGGPDEKRSDMESTHQASADSLWMHVELFLKHFDAKGYLHQSKNKFISNGKKYKTILMHTATFKLGLLHADDTQKSIKRVLAALRTGQNQIDEGRVHEQQVLDGLRQFCNETMFAAKEQMTSTELADLLQETVYVPKIGARVDFDKNKKSHADRLLKIY